jgi:hypothetical protein
MSRTITGAAALIAAVSFSLVGTVAVATTASADEAVNSDSPAVAVLYVAPTPVNPQPVVAGHEGDILMQVNVAMPAKAVKAVKAVKAAKGKKHSR